MSVVHQFIGNPDENIFTWENVEKEVFSAKGVEGVIKNVLVGPRDGAPNFVIRFFQVPIGGSTFSHAHPHEHGIVILAGKARILIENQTFELAQYDSVFVAGNDHHQVKNIGKIPLGFICVIPQEK